MQGLEMPIALVDRGEPVGRAAKRSLTFGMRPQPAVCERQVPGSPLSGAKRASLARPCSKSSLLSD
jgi:hypothetical protein